MKIYKALLGLSSLGLLFSILSEVQKAKGAIVLHKLCDATTGAGCTTVQESAYGSFLGIPNTYFGILGFSVMIALIYLQTRKHSIDRDLFICAGTLVASFMAIYFLYLQYAVIGAWCIYCVVVDIISIIMLVLTLKLYNKKLLKALKSYF